MQGMKMFRGKSFSKEWVLGSLVSRMSGRQCWIFVDRYYYGMTIVPVFPDTVHQMIQRKDVKNISLFEGDIIKIIDRHGGKHDESIAVVLDEHTIIDEGLGRWFPNGTVEYEKIGNIIDDSKLLSEKMMDYITKHMNFDKEASYVC